MCGETLLQAQVFVMNILVGGMLWVLVSLSSIFGIAALSTPWHVAAAEEFKRYDCMHAVANGASIFYTPNGHKVRSNGYPALTALMGTELVPR